MALPRPQNANPLLPPELPGGDSYLPELREFAKKVLQANIKNADSSTQYIHQSFSTLLRMYVVLFAVGLVTAVFAILKGFTATSTGEAVGALAIGGLSAVSFYGVFLTRPLESLERNAIFAPWLTAVVNAYWTRLMYFSDLKTLDDDLEDATSDLVTHLSSLADKHAAAIAKYPAPTAEESSSKPQDQQQDSAGSQPPSQPSSQGADAQSKPA